MQLVNKQERDGTLSDATKLDLRSGLGLVKWPCMQDTSVHLRPTDLIHRVLCYGSVRKSSEVVL